MIGVLRLRLHHRPWAFRGLRVEGVVDVGLRQRNRVVVSWRSGLELEERLVEVGHEGRELHKGLQASVAGG